MSIKNIERYLEKVTGCTREEVQRILQERRSRTNKKLFKTSSYEEYVYKKNNYQLGEEF